RRYRPEQLAVQIGGDVHEPSPQRAVGDRGPGWPVQAGDDARHGKLACRGLEVLQDPDLEADDPGIGPRVRDLHYVTPPVAGPQREVVVGFAGQAVQLTSQPEAG